jgi:hypothetical protein
MLSSIIGPRQSRRVLGLLAELTMKETAEPPGSVREQDESLPPMSSCRIQPYNR